MTRVPIYLEVGSKKVFACAVDWVGWCRPGKTEEQAIEALAAYHDRYAPVAKKAKLELPKSVDFDVVEQVKGNATTDFGAPGVPPKLDDEELSDARAADLVLLLNACWKTLDRVVDTAPASLEKGPRGGGRDRDKMFQHVLDAENAYARKMGFKLPGAKAADPESVTALRKAIAEGIVSKDEADPKVWPRRYAARRVAWHVLDHAWEIEDRSVA